MVNLAGALWSTEDDVFHLVTSHRTIRSRTPRTPRGPRTPREAWNTTPPRTTLDPVTPPHSRLLALLLLGVALPLSSCGGTVDEDPGARIVRIEGNNRDICATRVDGEVFCFDTWEANDQGNPVPVLGLPAPSSMSVGYDYACAIAGQGELWCWRWVRGASNTVAS